MTEATNSLAQELIPVLMTRAGFYQTLASLFFMPLKQQEVDAMAQADFSLLEEVNEDLKSGLDDIRRYLRKRNTGTRDELAVDFTGVFGGIRAYEGNVAVPYKSVFTSEDGLLYQDGFRDVYRAFKSECVRKRDGLDYPDDHISFMCEFMALLSQRAISDLENCDPEKALHEVIVSQEFLEKNVALRGF